MLNNTSVIGMSTNGVLGALTNVWVKCKLFQTLISEEHTLSSVLDFLHRHIHLKVPHTATVQE